MEFINISGYAFFDIPEEKLQPLKDTLKAHCRSLGLKGSILLANEGINCFLSGTRVLIDTIYQDFEHTFGFPKITFKESPSEYQPFKRMLVKVKKEIISMGCPQIKPSEHKAPYLSAQTLKQWLDEGKDLIILDTRNDYEIELGKFKEAVELDIDHFRQFPEALDQLGEQAKDKTIVTYCTGGIRCEKAAPLMLQKGFKNVYQLDGGILKYFEECGKDHYEGECFVFDKRVALDETLHETETVQCFACRMPVVKEKQSSPDYEISKTCPSCISKASKKIEERLSN